MAKPSQKQLELLGCFFSEDDLRKLGIAWRRYREGFPSGPENAHLVDLMRQHEDSHTDWDSLMMSGENDGQVRVSARLYRPLMQILMEASLKESIAANKPAWMKRLYDELTLGGKTEVDALKALLWALAKERMRAKTTGTRVDPKKVESLARQFAKENQ